MATVKFHEKVLTPTKNLGSQYGGSRDKGYTHWLLDEFSELLIACTLAILPRFLSGATNALLDYPNLKAYCGAADFNGSPYRTTSKAWSFSLT